MEDTLLRKVKIESLEALLDATTTVINEIKEAVPDRGERLQDEHYAFCLSLNLDIVQVLRQNMLNEQEDTNN